MTFLLLDVGFRFRGLTKAPGEEPAETSGGKVDGLVTHDFELLRSVFMSVFYKSANLQKHWELVLPDVKSQRSKSLRECGGYFSP